MNFYCIESPANYHSGLEVDIQIWNQDVLNANEKLLIINK